MEDKKSKITFKSIISLIILIFTIGLGILLAITKVNITRELVIIFWILLALNFLFVIVITISRLSNDFVTIKYYNYLFYKLYGEKLYLKDSQDFIDSILGFFRKKDKNIDFKKESIRLKEIIDSSYEITAFPILTLFFTVLYAVSIYDNNASINIINLSDEVMFVILDLVLLFTFIYIFTLTYLKTKTALVKLCLNIIKEYNLDKRS